MAQKKEKQPTVRPRQVWKENDPRDERYIRVIATYPEYAQVIRIMAGGHPYPNARITEAKLKRFRGQRSGYSFVRNLPETEPTP